MITLVVAVAAALGSASWFLIDQWHMYQRMAALALALDRAREQLREIDFRCCGCSCDQAQVAVKGIDEALERAELAQAVRDWKLSKLRGGSR